MPQFYFVPSARLQKFLGSELIADPDLAVAEFVKNSYDAGASEVHLDFWIAGRDAEEQVLTITDNGVGMDEASFEQNWMHPGFSSKVDRHPELAVSGATGLSAAQRRARTRTPTGEKGLGRLAAARLGKRLDVYTRETPKETWLHVEFDWRRFEENMHTPLHEIPIAYDFEHEPTGPRFRRGTVVRIQDDAQA